MDVYRLDWQADLNDQYIDLVRQNLPLIPQFKPDLLIWYYGFDTHAR